MLSDKGETFLDIAHAPVAGQQNALRQSCNMDSVYNLKRMKSILDIRGLLEAIKA